MLASVGQPGDVIVSGTGIYFTDLSDGAVLTVPIAGGAVTTLASGQADPVRLASDGTYIYWSSSLGAAIGRTRQDGTGVPSRVAVANQPWGLAVDATYVYWADTGTSTVLRAPKDGGDGGAPTWLANIPGPANPPQPPPELVAFAGALYTTGGLEIVTPDGPASEAGRYFEYYGTAFGGGYRYNLESAPPNPLVATWSRLSDGLSAGWGYTGRTDTPPIVGDSCGAYLALDRWMLPEATEFTWHFSISARPGKVVRTALAGEYIVWAEDGTNGGPGAIYKILLPQ
jgi:hypothetical protein